MNGVWIVLPVLCLLMFELGLALKPADFRLLREHPKPVLVGLAGQLLLLPLLAFATGILFRLDPLYFIGLMLIACSPGGSSSNVFSMIAGGDVALSVSLTAFSSLITLFTIPIILGLSIDYAGAAMDYSLQLPWKGLLMQNIVLMLLPIAAGAVVKRRFPSAALRLDRILSKAAFPCLMLLAAVFFLQHKSVIIGQFGKLGSCITVLILSAIFSGLLLGKAFGLKKKTRRTIVIEIGMQNAAQSIAIASSPFIFHNDLLAVPSIIYALMMNVILLSYVGFIRKRECAGLPA